MNPITTPWSALTRKEREFLIRAARGVTKRFEPPVVMVNIGVEHGCSLHCLREGAPRAVIYGVDLSNTRLMGEPGARLVTGDSTRVHERFDRSIHLLFVDGGHDYETVRGDLAWLAKVVKGGLAVFHDFYDTHDGKCPWILGVGKAVREWAGTACWNGFWREVERVDSIQAYRKC